jgi:AcrR family transcriptional regulator
VFVTSSSSLPPRQRRIPRAETRRRLIQAAAVVFAEKGYDATTLEQVAAVAGFSKGAVYSNFDGKQQLFLALLRERIEQRLEAVAHVTRAGDTAADRIERAGQALAELLERDPDWHRLFIEVWVRAVHDPHLQRELAEQRRTMRALIADTIDKQAAQLQLKLPATSDRLAVIVLALSNGIAIEHLADPDTVHPDLFTTALRLLLPGQRPPPQG